MGIKERRERQKETLRQEILDAAREILVHESYEQFSMRRIAKRIEYTPATIYLYFKDKNDLLFHLCEEVYGKVVEILRTVNHKEKDPVKRLSAAMLAYIEFGLSDPARYRIAFMTNVTPTVDPTYFRAPGSMAATAYDIFHQNVKEAMQQLSDRARDVESVTQVLWASAHGVISIIISHPEFLWVEQKKMKKTVVDLLMRGLTGKANKNGPKISQRKVK